MSKFKSILQTFLLPLIGAAALVGLWLLLSTTLCKGSPDGNDGLPSPLKTWEESKIYVLEPFAKPGERLGRTWPFLPFRCPPCDLVTTSRCAAESSVPFSVTRFVRIDSATPRSAALPTVASFFFAASSSMIRRPANASSP